MKKRTYISQEELNIFLNFLKEKQIWNYYLIVYNLVHLNKTYIELKNSEISDLIIPDGIPIPNENPFKIGVSGVSQRLKVHQTLCGIRDVNFSTRLFNKKFTMNGKVYYGVLKEKKTKNRKIDEGYIYILKHTHRDPNISKLLSDKKIGITYDIEKRTKLLTLGTIGIEVIKVWKIEYTKCRILEKKIHNHLKKQNIIGEWFSDENDDVIKIIEKIILENS